MRLARRGPAGRERPVISGSDGIWRDLRPIAPDVTAELLSADLGNIDLSALPVDDSEDRFGPPLARVGKIVCVGLNYRDHAAETGAELPVEPILFLKAADTIGGPTDPVRIPLGSTKTDWEVELGVVIGRHTRYLPSPSDARRSVAAYVLCHDVSERAFQLERGGQWDKGKNCETFNPMGPWLLSADAVDDPQDLALRLWVNGELRQSGNTADMIFPVDYLVWYISQFMTLYPGDVINTGTPAGVALGLPGQPYLRPGDRVALEIEGLGRQEQGFLPAS